jgi:hypothetical protein
MKLRNNSGHFNNGGKENIVLQMNMPVKVLLKLLQTPESQFVGSTGISRRAIVVG